VSGRRGAARLEEEAEVIVEWPTDGTRTMATVIIEQSKRAGRLDAGTSCGW